MKLRFFSLLLCGFLALITVGGCSGTNTSGAMPMQGIRGTATVRLNPGIPGPPPVINPLSNAIIVAQPASGGVEIGRAVADSRGEFELRLPVSTYLIVPLLPNPNNSPVTSLPASQTIVVQASQFTVVNFEYRSDAP